ncbi:pyruvate kinase [soil metagenome]
MRRYHHTKIIFTIGPASQEADTLRSLIAAGVDVCRLNMAHASPEWVRETVGQVRAISKEVGREIAVMMDIKGPEIRTRDVSEPIELRKDERFDFSTEETFVSEDGIRGVTVNYSGLPSDVAIGDTVLIDSGLIHMEVLETTSTRVRCRVLIPAALGSRRHINLPGVHVNLPSLTEKDRADVALGAEVGVDFFALSFVREAADIHVLRTLIAEVGSAARIVAKIEDNSGVTNIEEIVRATDAVMVARGDLGIEIPFESLPGVQDSIVAACLAEGKPVIIATQLLESMMGSPMPTRAEISDVATAIKELADCVMLSGETTVGKYPLRCVEVLNRIIHEVEPSCGKGFVTTIQLKDPKSKLLRSAANLAKELGGSVVVFSRSGFLPAVLAALRTKVPIYAFTDVESTFRQMLLYWGVEPFLMNFSDADPERTIRDAFAYLKRGGWCTAGEYVAVITNVLAHQKIIDTIQLRTVE